MMASWRRSRVARCSADATPMAKRGIAARGLSPARGGSIVRGMKAAGALLVGAIVTTCLGGCFVSPVMSFGGGKTSEQVQHQGLDRLFPAQIAATEQWRGAPRVA